MLYFAIVISGLLELCVAESPKPYSSWMLHSVIARGEGVRAADGLLSEIQKGFFQQSLRAAIETSEDPEQASVWTEYHQKSLEYGLDQFTNASLDALAPLDRLCAGRSILQSKTDTAISHSALTALRTSIKLQHRSANGGYWYFTDPPPPFEPYGNLSYSDGMYGFAPFATLYGQQHPHSSLSITSALEQLELIYRHTINRPTGLITHGYDASISAPWAQPSTGSSPVVWGRSMAWYMIGLLDALEITSEDPHTSKTPEYERMKSMFHDLGRANVVAAWRSAQQTGRYAVWQVADRPGEEGNWVEASASAMMSFVLAKGLRLGYLTDHGIEASMNGQGERDRYLLLQQPRQREWLSVTVGDVIRGLYSEVLESVIVRTPNGLLEFNGTSAMSSLHEAHLNYEYYVNRPRDNDSLIGESAFVLASLEMETWNSTA